MRELCDLIKKYEICQTNNLFQLGGLSKQSHSHMQKFLINLKAFSSVINQRIQEYPWSGFATQAVFVLYDELVNQNTEVRFSIFVFIIVFFEEQKELDKGVNASINNAIQYMCSVIIWFGTKLK